MSAIHIFHATLFNLSLRLAMGQHTLERTLAALHSMPGQITRDMILCTSGSELLKYPVWGIDSELSVFCQIRQPKDIIATRGNFATLMTDIR